MAGESGRKPAYTVPTSCNASGYPALSSNSTSYSLQALATLYKLIALACRPLGEEKKLFKIWFKVSHKALPTQ